MLEVLTGLSERAAEGAAAGAATAAGQKAGAARGGRPSEGDAEALSTGEDEDEDGAQEVDLGECRDSCLETSMPLPCCLGRGVPPGVHLVSHA